MTENDDYQVRVQAYAFHLQGPSETLEEIYQFLSAGFKQAEILPFPAHVDADTE